MQEHTHGQHFDWMGLKRLDTFLFFFKKQAYNLAYTQFC